MKQGKEQTGNEQAVIRASSPQNRWWGSGEAAKALVESDCIAPARLGRSDLISGGFMMGVFSCLSCRAAFVVRQGFDSAGGSMQSGNSKCFLSPALPPSTGIILV